MGDHPDMEIFGSFLKWSYFHLFKKKQQILSSKSAPPLEVGFTALEENMKIFCSAVSLQLEWMSRGNLSSPLFALVA